MERNLDGVRLAAGVPAQHSPCPSSRPCPSVPEGQLRPRPRHDSPGARLTCFSPSGAHPARRSPAAPWGPGAGRRPRSQSAARAGLLCVRMSSRECQCAGAERSEARSPGARRQGREEGACARPGGTPTAPRKEAPAPGGGGGRPWSLQVKGRKWRPLPPLTWILGGRGRASGAHDGGTCEVGLHTHTRPFPPPSSPDHDPLGRSAAPPCPLPCPHLTVGR